jgi:hypothetical protein
MTSLRRSCQRSPRCARVERDPGGGSDVGRGDRRTSEPVLPEFERDLRCLDNRHRRGRAGTGKRQGMLGITHRGYVAIRDSTARPSGQQTPSPWKSLRSRVPARIRSMVDDLPLVGVEDPPANAMRGTQPPNREGAAEPVELGGRRGMARPRDTVGVNLALVRVGSVVPVRVPDPRVDGRITARIQADPAVEDAVVRRREAHREPDHPSAIPGPHAPCSRHDVPPRRLQVDGIRACHGPSRHRASTEAHDRESESESERSSTARRDPAVR